MRETALVISMPPVNRIGPLVPLGTDNWGRAYMICRINWPQIVSMPPWKNVGSLMGRRKEVRTKTCSMIILKPPLFVVQYFHHPHIWQQQ